MSRVINLRLEEGIVRIRCQSEDVGISALETLPAGGVRLVCMSTDGAELIRRKLKTYIIKDAVTRTGYRPTSPLW